MSRFHYRLLARAIKHFTQKDVNFVQQYAIDYGSNAVPQYYSVYDVDNFIVSPTPDSNYTVELHYYRPASITAGSGSGTSWLSENAPNALLGSLVEAEVST